MARGGSIARWLAAGLGVITVGGAVLTFVLNAQKTGEVVTGYVEKAHEKTEAERKASERLQVGALPAHEYIAYVLMI
jgi:hypothetical protein